jgi:hypothetical protein
VFRQHAAGAFRHRLAVRHALLIALPAVVAAASTIWADIARFKIFAMRAGGRTVVKSASLESAYLSPRGDRPVDLLKVFSLDAGNLGSRAHSSQLTAL